MTDRILMKQAAFAAAQGWNRSTVTRLKQAGRLVMEGPLVDPVASLVRIRDTGGMRFDVAERHAAQRDGNGGSKNGADATAGQGEGGDKGAGEIAPLAAGGGLGERRIDAQARKESAAADLLEMELAQKRGQLIPKDDVDQALKAFAAATRARLDVLADQLAPILAPVADLGEAHALLAEHARLVLAGIADDMARAAAALGAPGA